MPQFDIELLIHLTLTILLVFSFFYFYFNSEFLSLISEVKVLREKIKALIEKYKSKK